MELEKGKSYQWYYDRLIAHGYHEQYAKNEAAEQCLVWGDGKVPEVRHV